MRNRKPGMLSVRFGMILGNLLTFALLPYAGWAAIYCDEATKRYHTDECPEKPLIKKKYLKIYNAEAEAEAKGFYPCPQCVAPARQTIANPKQIRQLALSLERGKDYVGDPKTHLYHYPWCERIQALKPKEPVLFKTAEKAIQSQYSPCKECNPPVFVKKAEKIIATPVPATSLTPLPQAPNTGAPPDAQ